MKRKLQNHWTNLKLEILYMSKDIPHPLETLKWDYRFQTIRFSMPHTAVLGSTLNGKSRNVNIGIYILETPFDILETDNISVKVWGGRAKLFSCQRFSMYEQNSVVYKTSCCHVFSIASLGLRKMLYFITL